MQNRMAYTDFTLADMESRYGLSYRTKRFSDTVPPLEPSDLLLQQLELAKLFTLRNEKMKSEFLIVPVLAFLKVKNRNRVQLFSGENLPADRKQKLNGEVDYIWVGKGEAAELQSPIICTCDAKKGVIEDSLGQCAAQMYGARVFNQKHNTPITDIYGCITSGTDWQFMKLEGQAIWRDTEIYSIVSLPQLPGAWQIVIDFFRPYEST